MEQDLQWLVHEVQGLYGEEVLAVILYGSGAAGEHVPGHSDINIAVALRDLTPALLRKAAGRLRAWHRRGFATPLFLDPAFLHASLDVFPIEFLDMQERHRVLWGQDLLTHLNIGRANLRLQCEQELRGKLLKLQQSYVESAHSPDALGHILGVAVSSLVVLARTLLRLAGEDPRDGADAILERAHSRFGVSVAGLRKAWQVKRGEIRLAGSGMESLYQEVLEEVQGLVRTVDGLGA